MQWFKTTTWTGKQVFVIKVSLISFGILIGTLFADMWKPWVGVLGATFAVTALWLIMVRIRMDAETKSGKKSRR